MTSPATPMWGRGTRVRGTRQAEALASVLADLLRERIDGVTGD